MGACKSKTTKPTRDEAEALHVGKGVDPQELSASPHKGDAPVDRETPPAGEAKLPLKAAKARQRDSCCSTSYSSSSSSGAPTADGEPGERGKAGPVEAPGSSPGVETIGDLRRRRLTVLGTPDEKTEEADSAAGPQHASLADRFKRPVEGVARLAASRSTFGQRVDTSPEAVGARPPGQPLNGAALAERREELVSLSTLVRQGSFSRSLHSSPPASVDGRLSLREEEERGERVDRGEGEKKKGERKGRGSEAENEAELIQQIRREKSLPVAVEEDDPIAAKALSFSREQLPSVVTPSEADDASILSGLGATTRSDAEASARKLLVPCARAPLPVSRDTLWKHPEVLTASLFLELFTPPQATPACCFLGAAAHCRQESFDDKVEDCAVRPPGSNVESVMRSLGFGFACRKGLKPDSPNQDDFAALCCSAFRLFGVFDGHGPSGHDVSGYVHRMLFALLLTDETLNRNPQLALRNAFVATHQSVLAYAAHTEHFDCSLSGSTASVVLQTQRKLFVAHVGDSRAVLARQRKDGVVAETLTVDHKPTTPAERARIEAAGGELKRLECDIPYRVFLKGRLYPGLAMSRALGDAIASHAGVSCEPDLSTVELDRSCLFVIIASDGVWEFISNQEAVNIVNEAMGSERKVRAKAAAERLALEAFKRWVEEEGNVVDDITCQIICLR
ncbi:UNVERIFIED_CONTAM: PP2C, putative [Hammondia hammondi]|eukprot:XP_008887608.1 PP2C, putative [Hammondia hammondi]